MSIQSLPFGVSPQASKFISSTPKFVRCVGRFVARDPFARDVAYLLDMDEAVSCWSCQSSRLRQGFDTYTPDFMAERGQDVVLIDAVSQRISPLWIAEAAAREGFSYQTMTRGNVDPIRLKNCKDLLHSAGGEVSLGDRVRILGALDEHSSLTVAEILSLFRDRNPIRAFANMVVGRFIEINLDDALIAPETVVRRYRG
jgi:hypothetical protein